MSTSSKNAARVNEADSSSERSLMSSTAKLQHNRYSEAFHKILVKKSANLIAKDLYNRCGSRILRHSSNHFEIVKFDEHIINGDRIVMNRLQNVTNYVDFELGNVPEEFKFDDDEHQVVYIMWIPQIYLVVGYLSAGIFRESRKLHSYIDGVVTVSGMPVIEPCLGITRLWCLKHSGSEHSDFIVMSCLLEACRLFTIREREVPKSDLAFLSLTDEMVNFLKRYLGYRLGGSEGSGLLICFPKSA